MTTALIPSYYLWMIFILPYLGSLVIPLIGKSRVRDYVAVFFPLASAIFALQLLLPILQGETISVYDSVIPSSVPWIPELGISQGVLSDPYTIIICNLVAWISFLVMVYSLDYMKGDSGLTRYWFFMNFFIGSMQLIVLSDNLLALLIGFEGVGLCSYALIGYHYKDEIENWVGTPGSKALGEDQAYSPSHAGMKAFFMTRIGDIALLAGIVILFVYSGTFNYHQLAASTSWATSLAGAGILVLVALLIFGGAIGKSAQFPLQEWLPDAMAGPAPVSALIHAATMVNAGVVLVARVGPVFYFVLVSNPTLIQPFFMAVAWIGAFTAFLAATQAMVGYELKKILAYSTISQIGYMILGLGLSGLSVNFSQGMAAGLFQLISHAIFKAALFMMAGAMIHAAHSKYINEMGGLRDKMKITFAIFLIAVASLSGIPPFSGFWAKDAVLATAWESGQTGLFLMGVLTAGITAFYAFRMLGLAFFGQRSQHLEEVVGEGHPIEEAKPLSWVPYAILGSGTVVVGILGFFNIDGFLKSVSTSYVTSLFTGQSFPGLSSVASFDIDVVGITLLLAVVGLVVASQLYVSRRLSPSSLGSDSSFVRGLHTFLENRWYINAIYYKVFVNVPLAIANLTDLYFETGILQKVNSAGTAIALKLSALGNWFDNSVVEEASEDVSRVSQAFSRGARKLQTGVLEQYVLIFTVGLLIMLILFIILTGVYKVI